MELLGKDLSEYKVSEYIISQEMAKRYSNGLYDWNVRSTKERLKDNFEEECESLFIWDDDLNTTDVIIAKVHVAKRLNLLTDEQFERAIPIIEKGLKMNIEYVELLDKLHPIIEEYCEKYGECFRDTLAERFKLEFWQGRFSNHSMNPKQLANYS